MPRSITGVYTLPETPFVAGTVIQSAPVNSDLSDIASALTQSLATNGVSAMTGPVKAAAGTVAAPSYAFANALGTGWYLAGANQIGWTANGVLAALFNADGTTDWAQDAAFAGDVAADTLTIVTSATIAGHPITNFPVGTVMVFNQTTAPVGWTKLLVDDNKALRLVTGTVGTGGSLSFTTVFGYTVVGNTATTLAQTAAHQHFVSSSDSVVGATTGIINNTSAMARTADWGGSTNYALASGGGSAIATVGLSSLDGSGSPHNHTLDTRVQYVDVILASKN